MSASVPVVLERDNVNDESVKLVRWFVHHGERVEADALLAEVETSKANMEVVAPAAGFLVWEFPEGAEVPVGSPIGQIAASAPAEGPNFAGDGKIGSMTAAQQAVRVTGEAPAAAKPAAAGLEAGPVFVAAAEYKQRFSPVAAKMMEANGLTAAQFAGKSAVRKQDVQDFLNGTETQPKAGKGAPQAAAAKASQTPITQPYRERPLSKMKRREGGALAAGVGNAVSSAVSVTCFTRGLRRIVESRMAGGNASAVIAYEVSRLLRKYPALNATYRAGAMIEYEQVNLGYAMDDGRGLKVAVLQNCDQLSLQDVTALMRELTLAYLDDKLTPAQIANATFTISDLSGMGISSFLPLISENQGGILGVGAEQFAPGSSQGVYTLTLTFDHQLSDGRTAALFLNDLKEHLLSYEGAIRDAQEELACSQCGRTAGQLEVTHQYLLRSVLPEGYICTLCVAGY